MISKQRLIPKAKGRFCKFCNQSITESEAESLAFEYVKSKSGEDILLTVFV